MLRVLGNRKRLCDGLTRRDLLQVGALTGLGLGLEELQALKPAKAASGGSFGRAKSCILLFLYGSPSQLETFDPKPDAPEGIRGELGRAIATNVPGLSIATGLPRIARVMDKASIVRSVTHPYPIHGVAYALTGIPRIDVSLELNPRDQAHWPFIGSVVDYAERSRAGGRALDVPRNLLLPWAFSSQRVGEVPRAGPYGGFLGSAFDPTAVEFVGKGTVKAKKTLQEKSWEDLEPYRGITPESRFRPSSVVDGGPGLTLDRMNQRRSLLNQLEDARREADLPSQRSGIDRHRDLAYSLLASDKLRQAFDIGREPLPTRERYGMTLFGQATLTARRLVEAGGKFVTVFWDEYGLAGTGWDTHWDHFARMKDELLPGLDQTLSGLLDDLDARGMLDETLVLCMSEHGRTPKIDGSKGGGRDHWSRCYSTLMAGGGIARGRVIGRSDKIASDPAERPISPKDLLATAYHLLGVDPDLMLTDRQGRPMPLVPDGRVVQELLA
jgi:uncharacterized protein (DUF1501 family)